MRHAISAAFAVLIAFLLIANAPDARKGPDVVAKPEMPQPVQEEEKLITLTGKIKSSEAMYDIFVREGLDINELYAIAGASKKHYNLTKVVPGKEYSIDIDEQRRVRSLTYRINADSILEVARAEDGFEANKTTIEYDVAVVHMGGVIEDNLVSSMKDLVLALETSDIFGWDIDFMTDIRKGDSFKLVVEEKSLNGEFVRYGNILTAEFTNKGKTYTAYRFVQGDRADYFNAEGNSMRRSLLKAPLSYRRISSGYTRRRLHPILKVYRPHLGVDYAAPAGTPVSTVGDGVVIKAGYYGANGRQVVVKHANGYITYYGHLSRISRGVRKGVRVKQGQVIGRVGSTGRSTGPHLDYRVKKNGTFVNPLRLRLPPGKPIREALRTDFAIFRNEMDYRLATIAIPVTAAAETGNRRG